MPSQTQVALRGHVDRADRANDEYLSLPFDVPPGVGRLEVDFRVSDRIPADQVGWREGNILDIGLFDPRGATFLTGGGFRGWSGSRRAEFFIARNEATPGYLAGPIYPGTWHVALGLYQIAAHGCDYEVHIAMLPEGPLAAGIAETSPPGGAGPVLARGARWYRGDLHAHTCHSDGTAPLSDLMAAARGQGLDFVAVTEHNTISHLSCLAREQGADLLLIPGVEISTYHGHANAWPIDGYVEFRCQSDRQMDLVRRSLPARGALFSVNHPKDGGPAWEFGRLFEPDCIEVWGGPWFISNYQALDVWDHQLKMGRRVTAVGGSDKHVGPYAGEAGWYDLGTPCTWVYADELSVRAIIEGIRTGRVFLSASPAGPRLSLTVTVSGSGATAVMGDQIEVPIGSNARIECAVVGAAGSVLRLVSADGALEAEVTEDSYTRSWDVTVDKDTYWRPEVIEPPEIPLAQEPAALVALALGNPIYMRVKSGLPSTMRH